MYLVKYLINSLMVFNGDLELDDSSSPDSGYYLTS